MRSGVPTTEPRGGSLSAAGVPRGAPRAEASAGGGAEAGETPRPLAGGARGEVEGTGAAVGRGGGGWGPGPGGRGRSAHGVLGTRQLLVRRLWGGGRASQSPALLLLSSAPSLLPPSSPSSPSPSLLPPPSCFLPSGWVGRGTRGRGFGTFLTCLCPVFWPHLPRGLAWGPDLPGPRVWAGRSPPGRSVPGQVRDSSCSCAISPPGTPLSSGFSRSPSPNSLVST